MSEQEMNSYRFTSGQEPSDEMLAQIMKEVTDEAKARNAEATAAYFANMRRQAEVVKATWSERIKAASNG
ncbi:MAG: hypothetical protein K2O00_04925 [Muribaculaceae bacterium]|nr:hypothetical protein [Muribaculaceae bacterium]